MAKLKEGISPLRQVLKKDRIKFMKNLITMNIAEAASSIGLDKHFSSNDSLRGAGYKLYQDCLNEEGLVSKEIIELIKASMERRKVTKEISDKPDLTPMIDPEDNKSVVIGGRNKAAMLLHKKMDRLARSNKLIDAVSITQLATTFAIMFDKSQILRGEATENIAVHAKIAEDMTPEETLNQLLKFREAQNEEKYGK